MPRSPQAAAVISDSYDLAGRSHHDKSLIHRQIDATDKQIDQLVYELYGLTDEEIRIVEEATQRAEYRGRTP